MTFVAVLLAACGNQSSSSAPELDAAFVAAEADKGNLVPLKGLAKACRDETVRLRRRADDCAAFEKASSLRRPLDTRF